MLDWTIKILVAIIILFLIGIFVTCIIGIGYALFKNIYLDLDNLTLNMVYFSIDSLFSHI
jgi:hypothetical protein